MMRQNMFSSRHVTQDGRVTDFRLGYTNFEKPIMANQLFFSNSSTFLDSSQIKVLNHEKHFLSALVDTSFLPLLPPLAWFLRLDLHRTRLLRPR